MKIKVASIGDFCKTGTGGTPSRSEPRYYDGDIPWIKSGELRENIIRKAGEFLTEEALRETRLKIVPSGAILIAMYGATVGRVARLGIPAVTNQAVCHVIPDAKIADVNYLYYCLRSKLPEFLSRRVGGAQPNISQGIIRETKIPLPPLDEQRRVAAVLDKADALREKRRQAINKLDTLLQAVFLDMFGDPVKNPKGWKLGILGDVIHSAKDGPHVSPQYSDEGIPFLSTRHIRQGRILWDDLKFITREHAELHWKKCKPERGDILYTKGGTTGIAKAIDFDREIAVWVHIALLKTNHKIVDPQWLEQMLNSNYCYAQSQEFTHGIANHDLGLTRMVKIKIYIPPIQLQRKFSEYATKLRCFEGKQEESLSKLDDLFYSLQQRAFNGELFNGKATAAALPRKTVTTSQPELFD